MADNKKKRDALGYSHDSAPFLGRQWMDQVTFVTVTSGESLQAYLMQCDSSKVALDTEATGLCITTNELVGISLSWGHNTAYYIPVGHKIVEDGECNVVLEEVVPILSSFLADKTLICFNRNFDIDVCEKNNIPVAHLPYEDVQVKCFNYDPNIKMPSLKDMSIHILGREMIELAELLDAGKDQKKKRKIDYRLVAEIPIRKISPYAGSDAINTFELNTFLDDYISRWGMADIFHLDNSLVEALRKLQKTDVYVNQGQIKVMLRENITQREELEITLKKQLGSEEINLNSPLQIQNAFLGLGIPLSVQTSSSTPEKPRFSVGEDALLPLAADYPIIAGYLKYTSLGKFKGYLEALVNDEKPDTYSGYLFCSSVVTPTGRLQASSGKEYDLNSLPINIQNQPKPEEKVFGVFASEESLNIARNLNFPMIQYDFQPGNWFCFRGCEGCPMENTCRRMEFEGPSPMDPVNIRKCFVVPDSDWFWVSVDFSQQELIIPALISNERTWLDALKLGLDLHTASAAKLFKVPYDQVTKKQRKLVKAANFGIQYGMAPDSLAEQFGLSVEEAQSFFDTYYSALPNLIAFLTACEDFAAEKGWIDTYFHRVRPLNRMVWHEKFFMKQFGYRSARSTKIQGTGGDIIRFAINRYYNKCDIDRDFRENCKFVITVHDEMNYYVRKDYLLEGVKNIIDVMVFDVPGWELRLPYSITVGKSWGEAVPYKLEDSALVLDVSAPMLESVSTTDTPVVVTTPPEVTTISGIDERLLAAYTHIWESWVDRENGNIVEFYCLNKRKVMMPICQNKVQNFMDFLKSIQQGV